MVLVRRSRSETHCHQSAFRPIRSGSAIASDCSNPLLVVMIVVFAGNVPIAGRWTTDTGYRIPWLGYGVSGTGAAHDFNNMLQVITGYLSIAIDDLKTTAPECDSRLDPCRRGGRTGQRADQTVVGLLAPPRARSSRVSAAVRSTRSSSIKSTVVRQRRRRRVSSTGSAPAMIARAVVGPGLGHQRPGEEPDAQADQKGTAKDFLHHGPNSRSVEAKTFRSHGSSGIVNS